MIRELKDDERQDGIEWNELIIDNGFIIITFPITTTAINDLLSVNCKCLHKAI